MDPLVVLLLLLIGGSSRMVVDVTLALTRQIQAELPPAALSLVLQFTKMKTGCLESIARVQVLLNTIVYKVT